MSGFPKLRLGDLCDKITDGTHHSPTNLPTGKYKYITAKNIKPWGLDLGDVTYVDEVTHREIYARCDVRKHDILYIKDGATTGVAIINPLDEEFSLLSSVGVLRPGPAVSPKYLLYALQEPDTKARMMDGVAGVAITRLTLRKLADAEVPVAALATQTRIVEKLEELLSDLDAGVAELKAAQKKLAQYRQSLLKAAVEGALTTEWRAARAVGTATTTASFPRKRESSILPGDIASHMDSRLRGNDGNGETGGQLLQRILTERRARWEAKQLAKFNEQGKTPPKDWQKKYPEPVQPDTSGLPELPHGWVWASVDQLTEFITSGSRGWADYYVDAGATFIRSQNINKDWLDLSDIAFVNPPQGSEGARTRVQKDDLLLTITGANVGKAAHVEADMEEAYVSQHVALMRPVDVALAKIVHLFLTAEAGGRGQLNKEAYGAGKPGLNLQQVAGVCVPLASAAEFEMLLKAVKNQLEAASAKEVAIELALKQSNAQRQNILRAAFVGKLVPQDPNDEPASVLLARIRAERAQREAVKKPRGRKPKDAA